MPRKKHNKALMLKMIQQKKNEAEKLLQAKN